MKVKNWQWAVLLLAIGFIAGALIWARAFMTM
ncbi:hypothetical protein Bsel_0514 [[Bacillus] selenitireducens MLS10]|uniref:Uncharacterized protein n=1 Tax=Bacillus selenitireducens (strain ATCC 700615 / DSM 15326 / MLS10) TaxID=439292 RepID=D6XXX7_BACIE|nr:hypothetical protein Bsel_0514 [[Bacillus] selenitireducens MLS10]